MTALAPALLSNRPPSALERGLLPWEDREALSELISAFNAEHAPQGPTEAGLVDRLVWLEWRRRRLVLGERALHMAALHGRIRPAYGDSQIAARARLTGPAKDTTDVPAIVAGDAAGDHADAADAGEDLAMTRAALRHAEGGGVHAYDNAIASLRDDTRGWWLDWLEEEKGSAAPAWSATAEGLARFLREEALPVQEQTLTDVAGRPAIRLQAHGESLDPDRMDKLLALDDRLLRQMEKTLAMLLRLREMRQGDGA